MCLGSPEVGCTKSHLHGYITCVVVQGPAFALMFCYHHLEILSNFFKRISAIFIAGFGCTINLSPEHPNESDRSFYLEKLLPSSDISCLMIM